MFSEGTELQHCLDWFSLKYFQQLFPGDNWNNYLELQVIQETRNLIE